MFGVPAAHQTRMIDFLLLPEFSMMAFTASVEPLRAANQLSGRPLYAWRSLSLTGDPVSASNGVVVHPAGGIDDAGPGATLFVCAGLRAERIRDKALFARLRELSRMGVGLGAVCTGALVLARAGLLDGYNCTIHWEHVEGFAEEFPELKITATLFEIDRDRYTCSGGTAPLRHDDQRHRPRPWRGTRRRGGGAPAAQSGPPSPRHPAYARPAPYRHLASQAARRDRTYGGLYRKPGAVA